MTDQHEATGSYALDALETTELIQFEAHLATCDTCQEEVAVFCAVAADLALLCRAAPPATLRTTILDAIAVRSRPPVRNVGRTTSGPAIGNGTRPDDPEPPAIGNGTRPDDPKPEVDDLARRRQRRRIRVLSSLIAALVALAVGLGGVVYALVQQRQAQTTQITLEEQLYAAPDATTVTVPLEAGGQVTFIASKQLDRALFIGTNLPDPGADRYQLWTGTGDPTVQNGITGVTRDNQVADPGPGTKVFLRGDIANADFLAVNLEPAGSTPEAPTNPVLAAGVL
jgi:anti-sigma factor RsiW